MTLFGPEELSQQILDPGLCTLCGACANICPYIKVHNNKIVTIFSCDRTEGRCYAHCPKVGALLDKMSQSYQAQSYTDNPIGEYIKIEGKKYSLITVEITSLKNAMKETLQYKEDSSFILSCDKNKITIDLPLII